MPDRKPWEAEEDKILKYLREQLQISKWSTIAKKMTEEYGMTGRTGKQCRERYHNHLDTNIIRTEWTLEEEQYMYLLHDQIGNKWAIIAQKLPGRTDNCVKNHFYSKLRKALRKLNKVIYTHYRKEIKEIKTNVLYKIIEAVEEKFKTNSSVDEEVSDRCAKIKKSLLQYSNEDEDEQLTPQNLNQIAQLAVQINDFASKYRRRPKKTRRNSVQTQDLLAIPRFEHKIKSLSEIDSEEDSEYSMVFSHQCDKDSSLDVGQRSVRSRSKSHSNLDYIKQEEVEHKEVEPFKEEDEESEIDDKRPEIRLNGRKSFTNPNQIQDLLKAQGMLEVSQFGNNLLNKNKESEQFDEEDDFDSEGDRCAQNMLSESIEGLKLGEINLDMDIELDDESNLFVSS